MSETMEYELAQISGTLNDMLILLRDWKKQSDKDRVKINIISDDTSKILHELWKER
jgi:hypothetical protein